MKTTIAFLSLSVCCSLPTCWADESVPNEPKEQKINFDDHIKPIFREHCSSCHSESSKESDLALDSYGGVKAGGSSGEVVAEGNTSGSRLFALITHAEQPFMPPDQDAIPQPQIDLVKTWIEQGMPENSGSKIKRSNNAAAAMLSATSLGKPDGPPPMPESLVRQPVVESERSAAIAAMSASPWAPLIAVGGQEQVSLYHSQTGELLGVLPFPEGEPQSLTFTRDGKQLLIGGGRHSQSGCAVLIDIATGERITKVGDELDIVLAADISPDKQRIAIAGPSKIVRIFDTASGEVQLEMKKHTDWIFALRYSPDGVLLATGDRSNGLIVWEADTGRVFTELSGHTGEVRSLDFRADSNVLASGSLDGTIRLWDMNATKEIKSFAAHGGGVHSVMFAQNGFIASAGRDARVKLWNGNGELQSEFQGLTEAALEVALTGDAAYVAGGDWNGQVQLWPAADPTQVKFIVANPPSIEKRLEQSQAQLTAKQAELAAAEQAASAATELATATQTELATANQTATQLTQQVTENTALDQTLTGELTQLDAKIKELEAQLAATKQQRQEVATRSEQASTIDEFDYPIENRDGKCSHAAEQL
ncbi:MAG: c-type cytochrome domain-containing protein [Pirellulaceae bacterium]